MRRKRHARRVVTNARYAGVYRGSGGRRRETTRIQMAALATSHAGRGDLDRRARTRCRRTGFAAGRGAVVAVEHRESRILARALRQRHAVHNRSLRPRGVARRRHARGRTAARRGRRARAWARLQRVVRMASRKHRRHGWSRSDDWTPGPVSTDLKYDDATRLGQPYDRRLAVRLVEARCDPMVVRRGTAHVARGSMVGHRAPRPRHCRRTGWRRVGRPSARRRRRSRRFPLARRRNVDATFRTRRARARTAKPEPRARIQYIDSLAPTERRTESAY